MTATVLPNIDTHQAFGTSGLIVPITYTRPFETRAPLAHLCAYDAPALVVQPVRGQTTGTVTVPAALISQLVDRTFLEQQEMFLHQARMRAAESLAAIWEQATVGQSAFRTAKRHPAYERLRRLGPPSIAAAIRRLQGGQRPLWLFFLRSAVDERPAAGADTVDEAAQAWRDWGRRTGLVP